MKICSRCETPNDDMSVICKKCGASLSGARIIQNGFDGNNTLNVNMPRPKPSMMNLVILLIIGAVFSTSLALVTLILACVSISYYLKYEECVKNGDYDGAADYTEKINKYYKIGRIFAVIGVALTVISVTLLIIIFGISFFTNPDITESFKAIFEENTVSAFMSLI